MLCREHAIRTSDGEKSIEQIQVGDYVLARAEQDATGRVEPKRVEEIYRTEGEVIELHVGGQPIRVTTRHPVYVKHRGWTPAGELREGDLLSTETDQSWIAVTRIEHATSTEPVFNLRIADHHTYFVGSKRWGFGVWVHNCSAGQCFYLNHTFHFLIRDNTTSTIFVMGRVSDARTQTENELAPTTTELAGDGNGDGQFNRADLVLVLQAGLYEQDTHATRETGDWNGDGYFDTTDFVYAFQFGRYEHANAARILPQPAPNPSTSVSRGSTTTQLDANDVDSLIGAHTGQSSPAGFPRSKPRNRRT